MSIVGRLSALRSVHYQRFHCIRFMCWEHIVLLLLYMRSWTLLRAFGPHRDMTAVPKLINFFSSISELEAIAADTPASKQFLMSPSEAKFVACLILRHGTNYKVSQYSPHCGWPPFVNSLSLICFLFLPQKMARDKENYNQLTEGQLKKKCLYFHKSPYAYLLDADD